MAFDSRSFAGSPHHAAGGLHPIFIRNSPRAATVHRIRASTEENQTRWSGRRSASTRAEIIDRTKAAVAANAIPAPEVGTMTYMMAKNAYHSDRVAGPWHPHLMFFLPRIDVAEWGANVSGSPVMGAGGATEPWTVFFVPVATWSDGTPDAHPPMMHKM